jgi:uncharacterized protein (TIGR02145 family)
MKLFFKFLILNIFSILANTSFSQNGVIKDLRDSRVYKTIQIGDETWMAENLNAEKFKDGSIIPQAKTELEWQKYAESRKPAWCYYNNEPVNGKIYGKLYNWYAVIDPRGLAPKGYHVPTDAEWVNLVNSLGGFNSAGKNLKSNNGWLNEGGEKSLFEGLPSGVRDLNGNFYGVTVENGWWSSTETTEIFAFRIKLGSQSSNVDRVDLLKKYGLSVRCIKNKSNTNEAGNTSVKSDDALAKFLAQQIMNDMLSPSSQSSSGRQTGSTNSTTNSSTNKSSSEVCSYCKPYDRKGHYVQDFDISKRTFINGRYIIRPGYKICSSCTGTGLQSIRGPGVCNQCNGEKLKKCSNCRGSGLKN